MESGLINSTLLRAIATRVTRALECQALLIRDDEAASLEEGLTMADGIILATARRAGDTLWTQDADFEGMTGVRCFMRVSN